MSTHLAFSPTGKYAHTLLRLLSEAVNVFPPLRSVAADALRITEITKSFRTNKEKWEEFGAYVQSATAIVIESLALPNELHDTLGANVEKLRSTLDETVKRIQSQRTQPRHARLYKLWRDPEMIEDMRKQLDDVIGLFELGTMIATNSDAKKTLQAVMENCKTLDEIARSTSVTMQKTMRIESKTASISHKVSAIALNTALERLRYVQGASWDIHRVCLPNTRIDIISEVYAWINGDLAVSKTQVLLLTAVAGAGKSTIAHTIAQHYHKQGQLVSSFFFDRETEGRNSPIALFHTIAADISRLNKQISIRITSAIEDDRSLPFAPLSRQFEELVLRPVQECPLQGPLVIVIDALDEGWSQDMLRIFRDRFSDLPSVFRVFVTSRMRPELDGLQRKPHVRSLSLDIGAVANLQDIALFIPHRLRTVAEERDLGDDWPGEVLTKRFEAKAEGLFLWVTTVCDYLYSRVDPTRELSKLVSSAILPATSAEIRMDRLYETILGSCDWEDEEFVADYHRLMGATLATKTPLTIFTMNDLFDGKPVASSYTLQQLSPLLTGTNKAEHNHQPVRVLHQSLRDFVVVRASESPQSAKFHIVVKKHSENLALLCLRAINRGLSDTLDGTGYLAKDESELPGVPAMNGGQMSEGVWYACRWWIGHLVDATPASCHELEEELMLFMDSRIILWMEVIAARGRLESSVKVREWAKKQLSTRTLSDIEKWYMRNAEANMSMSSRLVYEDRQEEALLAAEEAVSLYRQLAVKDAGVLSDLAQSLLNLSNIHSNLGSREESLKAIEEAVALRRQLAADRPAAFDPALANSLNNLSLRVYDMGRREDALKAIEEAVGLHQQLATDHPATFNPALAKSLNNLSLRLSDMGQREDALKVIEKTVGLYRQLATDRPASFNPDLAMSVNNLSLHLSDMGRRQDALKAIEEAVGMYRQLAAERPATFNPDLAMSLNNLSLRLSDIGQRKDALKTIEEAVELYRQLATDRPAAFNPELADSVNNFSLRLSDAGRREDALKAIEEAVVLYRQLAADRPAIFNPDLAMSLNNLSNCLSDIGQREDALKKIEEAVELRRQLATDRPTIFNPDLAMSLNNLSLCLSDMGQREDALKAIEEAVELRRQLAANHPATFNPDLAMSLNNLSNCLSNMGQREDALKAIKEAAELRRQLAADHPATFNPDLAMSLNNLSNCLSNMGQREDALKAIEEAVELRRQLAAERPAASNPDLAMSLNNLSNRLYDIGQREDALKAIEEAVELRRHLAAGRPAAFNPDLANSLNNLSNRLSNMSRREDALKAIEEAVELRRQLATDRPAVFNPDLAESLSNLSLRLSDMGRPEEALKATEEAVKIYRPLAINCPAVFIPDLVGSLRRLTGLLRHLGRFEEALDSEQEVKKLAIHVSVATI